jgi:colanic acid biosynthesis glycosyl transferase WcaI
MKILILSQFFHPEIGAPAARFYDFAQYFIARGHEVHVLTGFPNFPSGKMHAGYEGRRWMREEIDGIQVHRSWIFASEDLSFRSKALGYASFMTTSALAGMFRVERPDILLSTAPPPTIGAAAIALSMRFGIPLIHDLRDLWPEALVLGGRLKEGMISRSLERLNRMTYKRASAITTVSDGKRTRLVEEGVPADKIHVIPNGVDLDYFDEAVSEESTNVEGILRRAGVPEESLRITYAGIMNPPQGLPILLDAAEALAAEAPELHFVLVGSGSMREELLARAHSIPNATLIDEQPRRRIPAFLSGSFANAVTLRPRKDTHTVPSKIFEYMASRRPLLLSADSEPARIADQAGAGPISAAGDLPGLLANIRSLLADKEAADAMGNSGRKHVDSHYNRSELNARFLSLVSELVDDA